MNANTRRRANFESSSLSEKRKQRRLGTLQEKISLKLTLCRDTCHGVITSFLSNGEDIGLNFGEDCPGVFLVLCLWRHLIPNSPFRVWGECILGKSSEIVLSHSDRKKNSRLAVLGF